MTPHGTIRAARIAGAWYLLLVVTSLPAYIYQGSLVVSGSAAATAHNIRSSEMPFRVSILLGLTSAVAWIFLVRALYRLLSSVDERYASLMLILVPISVALSFVGSVVDFAALTVARGGGLSPAFSHSQLDALVVFFLNLSGLVSDVNSIFFGLWLLPFGLLVYRSGFIPRVFGVLLVINCFTYLAISLINLLNIPSAYANVLLAVLLLPQAAGEISIMVWLLIKGATVRPLEAQPA